MRTTLDLNDDLLRRAMELAARTNRTLTSVVEDALREVLDCIERRPTRGHVHLPVSQQVPGVCTGVNLNSAAHLLDHMERSSGSA